VEPNPRRLKKVFKKVQGTVTHLLTKVHALKQTRDLSNLGKVVSFATQDSPNTAETTNPAIDEEHGETRLTATEPPQEAHVVEEISPVEPIEEQQKVDVAVSTQAKDEQNGDTGGAPEIEGRDPTTLGTTTAEVDKE
jgi:hypothetical protein